MALVAGTSKSSRFNLTLKPDVVARLDAYARAVDSPKSRIIARALTTCLAEWEEDLHDAELAAAAWKEFEESGEEPISAKDLWKELGI